MQFLLNLLSVAGIAFMIKQTDGPFDLFAKLRNNSVKLPLIGLLFYHLFVCDFCLGFWSSILFCTLNSETPNIIAFSFAGGAFNLIFNKLLDKLISEA